MTRPAVPGPPGTPAGSSRSPSCCPRPGRRGRSGGGRARGRRGRGRGRRAGWTRRGRTPATCPCGNPWGTRERRRGLDRGTLWTTCSWHQTTRWVWKVDVKSIGIIIAIAKLVVIKTTSVLGIIQNDGEVWHLGPIGGGVEVRDPDLHLPSLQHSYLFFRWRILTWQWIGHQTYNATKVPIIFLRTPAPINWVDLMQIMISVKRMEEWFQFYHIVREVKGLLQTWPYVAVKTGSNVNWIYQRVIINLARPGIVSLSARQNKNTHLSLLTPHRPLRVIHYAVNTWALLFKTTLLLFKSK